MAEPAAVPARGSLRILTWNIRHLRDDRRAVLRVLRAADPDLVCLQESPRLPSSRLRLHRLARHSGLRYVAGGRSGAGTAILCGPRVQVGDVLAFRFPRGRLRAQRRGAVLVTVTGAGFSGVRVACVHLGLDGAERLQHVLLLLRRLAVEQVPVLVAGDLNEPPSGPSWRALAALVQDPAPGAALTFPAARPRRRIDAVLTGPGIATVEYGSWQPDAVDARAASDHLPVLSVISLRPAPER